MLELKLTIGEVHDLLKAKKQLVKKLLEEIADNKLYYAELRQHGRQQDEMKEQLRLKLIEVMRERNAIVGEYKQRCTNYQAEIETLKTSVLLAKSQRLLDIVV